MEEVPIVEGYDAPTAPPLDSREDLERGLSRTFTAIPPKKQTSPTVYVAFLLLFLLVCLWIGSNIAYLVLGAQASTNQIQFAISTNILLLLFSVFTVAWTPTRLMILEYTPTLNPCKLMCKCFSFMIQIESVQLLLFTGFAVCVTTLITLYLVPK
jgi:hypothetical protein